MLRRLRPAAACAAALFALASLPVLADHLAPGEDFTVTGDDVFPPADDVAVPGAPISMDASLDAGSAVPFQIGFHLDGMEIAYASDAGIPSPVTPAPANGDHVGAMFAETDLDGSAFAGATPCGVPDRFSMPAVWNDPMQLPGGSLGVVGIDDSSAKVAELSLATGLGVTLFVDIRADQDGHAAVGGAAFGSHVDVGTLFPIGLAPLCAGATLQMKLLLSGSASSTPLIDVATGAPLAPTPTGRVAARASASAGSYQACVRYLDFQAFAPHDACDPFGNGVEPTPGPTPTGTATGTPEPTPTPTFTPTPPPAEGPITNQPPFAGNGPDVLLSAQGQQLDAYNLATGERWTMIPPEEFVNGQICAFPPDGKRFLMSRDLLPFIGWGVFTPSANFQQGITTGEEADPVGCVFDEAGRLFATDGGEHELTVATGRLLEFFPPKYDAYCVLDDGLGSPGMIALDGDGGLLVPEPARGTVWRYSDLPSKPGACKPPDKDVFIADAAAQTPVAIVRSPWDTWFVSSALIPPSIVEYALDGTRLRTIVDPGVPRNPLGMAFDSAGSLYYAELALGPNNETQEGQGAIRKVAFVDGDPLPPVLFAAGLSFPDGLAVVPGKEAGGLAQWPAYGRDPARTFHDPFSLIDQTNVSGLQERWFLPTEDAVTAQPAVVDGVAYVGDWMGDFHAVDVDTGEEQWRYRVDVNEAVFPHPGAQEDPRRLGSVGGQITSSATVAEVHGRRLVIFGGGKHVYALDASTGALVWKQVLPGDPEHDPKGLDASDETQVLASPLVFRDRVYLGVSNNGQESGRGYFVALNAVNGKVVWRFETDPDPATGAPLERGCGRVWGSAAADEAGRLVIFGVSDCGVKAGGGHTETGTGAKAGAKAGAGEQADDLPRGPYNGRVVALDADSGHVRWVFTPTRPTFALDRDCDFDFGATPNVFDVGDAELVGIGGKDGTYYAIDRATGSEAWSERVVYGGFSGGFVVGTAFDGRRIHGATALGQFGVDPEFVAACTFDDPGSTLLQDPSFHAFEAGTGEVAWQRSISYSFAATVSTGGVVFNGKQFAARALEAYHAETGALIASFDLGGPVYGTGAIVGECIFSGTGGPEQFTGVGLHALCLGG